MISLPLFEALTLNQYGLLPPSMQNPYRVEFQPGPSVIAGTNGSGKTTLIGIVLRCLTGPYDLPAATSEQQLGQVRPRVVALHGQERHLFARRVADGAEKGTATLELQVGSSKVAIERRLSDLSLNSLIVDEKVVDCQLPMDKRDEDATYQKTMATLFGVGSFFDVLIVLRYLVFLLEDRRTLVWDPTAQRQIFRVLLLEQARATKYAEAQQSVISADSAVRNTHSLITRHERELTQIASRVQRISNAEAELRVKSAESAVLREKLSKLSSVRADADGDRQRARLDRLRSEDIKQKTSRGLEQTKWEALSRWLKPTDESAHYILGLLLAEKRCLICGTEPSPIWQTMEDHLKKACCPLCGSTPLKRDRGAAPPRVDQDRIARIEDQLRLADEQIQNADQRISDAQARFKRADEEFIALESRRVRLEREIAQLLGKIPAERSALVSKGDEVEALRRILADERRRLSEAESRFRAVSTESVQKTQEAQDVIRKNFETYLQVFLQESATLVYQTIRDRVGQSGSVFDFPAFRLSMTGGAVAGQTIREGPDAVSLSQAEFVDLAFRMALMTFASNGRGASLVVDAPEASLDFLFAQRAGEQLAKFSRSNRFNRVIITSYLPSVHLVKAFLQSAVGLKNRRSRITDLIRDGAPTAALRADKPIYEKFLSEIIDGSSNV